jgi:hypothetical protein
MNGLQEQLEGQQAASEEVREQFKALVEECGAALSSRAEDGASAFPNERPPNRAELIVAG